MDGASLKPGRIRDDVRTGRNNNLGNPTTPAMEAAVRILITGGSGQLGRDLQKALAEHRVRAFGHEELDVTDAKRVIDEIETLEPEVVIHAAALTDTGRCEREPDAAFAVNALGSRNVAVACARAEAAMVYVSTNEVFDGVLAEPYGEMDEPRPVNSYGRSKLAGERLVETLLPRHYIVRTAWLYGHGGDNFISKILRAADRGDIAGVVDETATPTWTQDLAHALAQLIETGLFGVYHLTNGGQASRYQWSREILRLAGKSDAGVRPVTSQEFRLSLPGGSRMPQKPQYSVLRNLAGAALNIELRSWQDALAAYFAEDPTP